MVFFDIPFFSVNETQAYIGKKLWDLTQLSRARFSDAIDRLNCHIIGLEPTRCLRSNELTDDEYSFALEFCSLQNHYYIAPGESIPMDNSRRLEQQIGLSLGAAAHKPPSHFVLSTKLDLESSE
ncbi:hypothetical protein niasHT_024586 [Heterodera trifolii]|uniref:Uncharacterized protein n=1 Tax=Heterodera trifolii TaxID=157864 RepID=A0ABD2K7J4_9BILA